MLVADQYIRGPRARRVVEKWCRERGGCADSLRRRRARAAPVLPRPHKSTKTADDWRACALVTCSTSLARPCLSRGSPTQSNEEWAFDTVGEGGRRRQPRERSAALRGLCEAAPRAGAASRAHADSSPSPSRWSSPRRTSAASRVEGRWGGAEALLGGSLRLPRASLRARREASTRAAAKEGLALEVADAAGARGEARGGARGAQELDGYVRGRGIRSAENCNGKAGVVSRRCERGAARRGAASATQREATQRECGAARRGAARRGASRALTRSTRSRRAPGKGRGGGWPRSARARALGPRAARCARVRA
jgi:hypothetical protein